MAVRALADLKAVVPVVAAFEPAMRDRSDADLRAVTDRLRRRHEAGDRLDDLVPEACAAEEARIGALPTAEQAPAVAALRWAAPPEIDLQHERIAYDVLRHLLQAKVKVRERR